MLVLSRKRRTLDNPASLPLAFLEIEATVGPHRNLESSWYPIALVCFTSLIGKPSNNVAPVFDESTADWWPVVMTVGCAENVDTTDDADDDYLANMYADYDLSMSNV